VHIKSDNVMHRINDKRLLNLVNKGDFFDTKKRKHSEIDNTSSINTPVTINKNVLLAGNIENTNNNNNSNVKNNNTNNINNINNTNNSSIKNKTEELIRDNFKEINSNRNIVNISSGNKTQGNNGNTLNFVSNSSSNIKSADPFKQIKRDSFIKNK
jgi:hypothetical protein